MRSPVPKRVLMIIEHQEPTLVQQVLFTDANGKEQRQTFTYEDSPSKSGTV